MQLHQNSVLKFCLDNDIGNEQYVQNTMKGISYIKFYTKISVLHKGLYILYIKLRFLFTELYVANIVSFFYKKW